MSKPTYAFREGARFQPGAKPNPQAVGEHLELLKGQAEGDLTPEAVVADAQHDNSPLHNLFEWDDTEAARQHRLHQARNLIGVVVVRYLVDGETEPRNIRAFVNLKMEDGGHVYRSTIASLQDPQTRDVVLSGALRELQTFERKYRDLAELSEVFDALARVEKPRRRRKAA
jgi:hypothetical protein